MTSRVTIADLDGTLLSGDQTIELWIRRSGTHQGLQNPLSKSYTGEGAITIGADNTITYYYGSKGSQDKSYQDNASKPNQNCVNLKLATPLQADTWTHLAIVRDLKGKVLQWYKDGQPAGSGPATVVPAPSPLPLLLGQGYANELFGGKPFKGELAEIRIWKKARSQAEVAATMNRRLRGDEEGLVGYWPLSDATADRVQDSAASPHHGRLEGKATLLSDSGLKLTQAPPRSSVQPISTPLTPVKDLLAPLVDPDLLPESYPASNGAQALWKTRKDEIAQVLQQMQARAREVLASPGGTPFKAIDAIITLFFTGITAQSFPLWADNSKEGIDISADLARAPLTAVELTRLAQICRMALESTPLVEEEWSDLYAILVQSWKRGQFLTWRTQELEKGIVLSPEHFKHPPSIGSGATRPELPTWRASGQSLLEWEDALVARFSQEADIPAAVHRAVDSAEAVVMPLLRDARLDAAVATGTLYDKANVLSKTLLIDMASSGSVQTTRLSQAIETLQSLLWSIHLGKYVGFVMATDPLHNFEADWKWMGSYAPWRAAMLVHLYPENILRPGLRTVKSPAFERLMQGLVTAPHLTGVQAQKLAETFAAELNDIADMALIDAITIPDPVSDSPERSAVLCVGRAQSSKTLYFLVWRNNPATPAFWHPIQASGLEEVQEVFGLAYYEPPGSGKRRVYLFVRTLHLDQPGVAFLAGNALSLQWESTLTPIDPPEDASGWELKDAKAAEPKRVILFPVRTPIRNRPPQLVVQIGRNLYSTRVNIDGTALNADAWKLRHIGDAGQLVAVVAHLPGGAEYAAADSPPVADSTPFWAIVTREQGIFYRHFGDHTFPLWLQVKQENATFVGVLETWEEGAQLVYRAEKLYRVPLEATDATVKLDKSEAYASRLGKLSEFLSAAFGVSLNTCSENGMVQIRDLWGGDYILHLEDSWMNMVDSDLLAPQHWEWMRTVRYPQHDTLHRLFAEWPAIWGEWRVNLMKPSYALQYHNIVRNAIFVGFPQFIAARPAWRLADEYAKRTNHESLGHLILKLEKEDITLPDWNKKMSEEDPVIIQEPTLGASARVVMANVTRSQVSVPYVVVPEVLNGASVIVVHRLEANTFKSSLRLTPSLPFPYDPFPQPFDPKTRIWEQIFCLTGNTLPTAPNTATPEMPTAIRTYLDEAFYFVPMQLALQLQQSGRYTAALDWFRTVYDDTQAKEADREIWYRLRDEQASELSSYNRDTSWYLNPLDPHAIAGRRANTYTRYTLLTLVNCLVEYADAEYARDTAESVPRARRLYLEARDLLETAELKQHLDAGAQPVGKVELEALLRPDGASMYVPYSPMPSQEFCIPANPMVQALRMHIELNLFKLRSGRNIAGMERQLEPYTAPTDMTSGLPTIGASGQLSLPGTVELRPTLYRFPVLLERARRLTEQAAQLENAMLSALQQRDQAYQERLRARQDIQLARATVNLQDLQVRQAENGVRLAELQRDRAHIQAMTYQEWIDAGLNQYEQAMLEAYRDSAHSRRLANGWSTAASVASSTASALSAAAQAEDLWKASSSLGAATITNAAAAAAHTLAATAQGIAGGFTDAAIGHDLDAQLASFHATHERRKQEWTLQKRLADQDLRIGSAQIRGAQDGVRIAAQERTIASLRLDHAEAMSDYLANDLKRFGTLELYTWMSGILQNCYRYFLQTATSVARLAETQLAFERQETEARLIQDDYWEPPRQDTLTSTEAKTPDRRGVTGSARLLQDLTRLDQHAFETAQRRLQLTRTVSLARLDPVAFETFRQTGVLNFHTKMALFDQDFPGHYLRLIRRVRTSVIALIPPLDGIKAMLTAQTTSHTVIKGKSFSQVPIQLQEPEQVALTSPRDATGLFELMPQEQTEMRYPFEGMGVDARWELRMPKRSNRFDYSTLVDVLFTLEYTALHSEEYRHQVQERLGNTVLVERPFSLRNDFPDLWFELTQPTTPEAKVKLEFALHREDFPPNLDKLLIKDLWIAFSTSDVDALKNASMTVTFPASQPAGPTPNPQKPREPELTVVALVEGRARLADHPGLNTLLAGKSPLERWALMFTAPVTTLAAAGSLDDILIFLTCSAEAGSW